MPGSSLRGRRRAERGSFALSGPCEEEVCRVNSSRQVNSGQMEPRSLPGDTRQARFAQPGHLFALGRAFPSIRRQQWCWDVTPSSLAGLLHHPPGWVPASGVWALLWHGGAGRLRGSPCHQPGYRGLTSHSQGSVWCPGPSTTAKRAQGAWGAQQRWGRAAGCTSWPRQTPLLWDEGLLLSLHCRRRERPGRARLLAADARRALAHVRVHLAPSPGLQHRRDAPSPGCEILSWLIQLAQLALLPPHPESLHPSLLQGGKLRHWDVQD